MEVEVKTTQSGDDVVEKKDLLRDVDLRELIVRSQSGDREARDHIVESNVRLVWSVVQRFMNRGYEADDLFQIGCIGLVKAVDKFDLSYEVKFSTYAVPMIIGEIQRFLRDDGSLKVSRSVKELGHKVRRAREELSKESGRAPSVNEIADYLGVSAEDVIASQEAIRQPSSIHETVFENDGDPITLLDQIADKNEGSWFESIAVHEAIRQLDERERLIVYLRYFKDQTQTEVANRLGISQVQVSRLEKKILEQLKTLMS
ncbi:MAG: RNA polymerase sporulation sigma factor SigF [Bacilli bacterium]